MFSIQTAQAGKEFREIRQLIKDQQAGGRRHIAKMMAVILLPIGALLALSVFDLVSETQVYTTAEGVQQSMTASYDLTTLIVNLQNELGLTALHITAQNVLLSDHSTQHSAASNATIVQTTNSVSIDNDKVMENLTNARKAVDATIGYVKSWLPITFASQNRTFTTVADLFSSITAFRHFLDSDFDHPGDAGDIAATVALYTNITGALIGTMISNVEITLFSDLWRYFVAVESLLMASDATGLVGALGSTYFVRCYLDDARLVCSTFSPSYKTGYCT